LETVKMIFERFVKLADGVIVRCREVQTELAEWEQVGPRCWQRKMREWDAE
jgi:hypothetical protein